MEYALIILLVAAVVVAGLTLFGGGRSESLPDDRHFFLAGDLSCGNEVRGASR